MVDSCLQGQETQVQDLHGKLSGSYIKPEMQVEIYSLTMWMNFGKAGTREPFETRETWTELSGYTSTIMEPGCWH